ncbi:NTTRR-F1 domain [Bacillus sp. AFS059628]|uniref:NTTRR-F1 domain n=1 Tax=Bacillus sp. AFS059628 TaxID=2033508 RepID=UPI0015D4ACC7|nr:NTTRR-F1 domain [Bacillus sp. AFS059628]
MIKNRIVNGGFETGTLSPFIVNNPSFVSINNSTSHSGVYSAKLSGGLATAIIAQAVPVSQNETFELFVSLSKVGPFPSPLIAINVQYYNGNTFLGDGLVTFILSNRIPDNIEKNWLEIYETASPAPATANTALVVIAKFSELGSADVFIDDVALLSIGPTGTPTPETTCFQDMKAKLQHCTGRYVSLVLSGCCTPIQGQISSVDEGTIVFISAEGTSIISICNIVLFTSVLLAYVTNFSNNSVSIINTSTNTIIAPPILVGASPVDIAITPNGTRAFVINQGGDTVSVINTITNTVIGAPIPVGNGPSAIAITPDGTRAFVTTGFGNTVFVINTITNTPIGAPIPVGNFPSAIAITPDGTRAFVTNQGDNTVSVINTITNTPIGAPIPVGDGPSAIAITPDGTRAFVTNRFADTVSVINTITNTPIGAPIPVGDNPLSIAITPDGTRAFVTNGFGNTVSVINTITNTPIGAAIPVGNGPADVAITPDGTRAYVIIQGDDTVSAINTITNTPIGAPIPVGISPTSIAITPSCI